MPIEQVIALRGATTIEEDTKSAVTAASVELLEAVLKANGMPCETLTPVYLTATTTSDIVSFYPVRAVRESGLFSAPVFSGTEPNIEGALPRCIRFLILVTSTAQKPLIPKHVYLHRAKTLRADLNGGEKI